MLRLRLAPMRTVAPGSEKPMALESRLVRICSTRFGSATKLATSAPDLDVERQVARVDGGGELLRHRLEQRRDVDLLELQLHGACIDGGEVDDGVDDGLEISRGLADVADVIVLLRRQRPGEAQLQAFGEAEDRGERRPDLVGDVGEEHVLEAVRGLQRIGTVTQRALHAGRVRDVREGEERVAVRQRHGGVLQHACPPR